MQITPIPQDSRGNTTAGTYDQDEMKAFLQSQYADMNAETLSISSTVQCMGLLLYTGAIDATKVKWACDDALGQGDLSIIRLSDGTVTKEFSIPTWG